MNYKNKNIKKNKLFLPEEFIECVDDDVKYYYGGKNNTLMLSGGIMSITAGVGILIPESFNAYKYSKDLFFNKEGDLPWHSKLRGKHVRSAGLCVLGIASLVGGIVTMLESSIATIDQSTYTT